MDAAISTAQQPSPQRLSWTQVLVLHLIPAVAMTAAFVTLAWFTRNLGWPPSLALLLAWLVVGLPMLLGLLAYQRRGLAQTRPTEAALPYLEPMPLSQYAWLVPVLLVWAALASTLLLPLGETIRRGLFGFWPAWLDLTLLGQDPGRYPTTVLWAVVALSAVLNIAVPIAEELYFRGYLLPRLPTAPRWAPPWSVALFSLYHFWLPWDLVGRAVALLPVVYAVQWRRNVRLSILVHCLLNLVGTVGLAVLAIGAAGA